VGTFFWGGATWMTSRAACAAPRVLRSYSRRIGHFFSAGLSIAVLRSRVPQVPVTPRSALPMLCRSASIISRRHAAGKFKVEQTQRRCHCRLCAL